MKRTVLKQAWWLQSQQTVSNELSGWAGRHTKPSIHTGVNQSSPVGDYRLTRRAFSLTQNHTNVSKHITKEWGNKSKKTPLPQEQMFFQLKKRKTEGRKHFGGGKGKMKNIWKKKEIKKVWKTNKQSLSYCKKLGQWWMHFYTCVCTHHFLKPHLLQNRHTQDIRRHHTLDSNSLAYQSQQANGKNTNHNKPMERVKTSAPHQWACRQE